MKISSSSFKLSIQISCSNEYNSLCSFTLDINSSGTVHFKTPRKKSIEEDRIETEKKKLHLPIDESESLCIAETCLINDEVFLKDFVSFKYCIIINLS